MNKIIHWHKLFGFKLYAMLAALAVFHIIGLIGLGQSSYIPLLGASYLVNAFFTLLIIGVLYELRISQEAQLGYLFMAASMFKIATFFGLMVWYQPAFLDNTGFNTTESIIFFTPYMASMIFETIYLIRFLNIK